MNATGTWGSPFVPYYPGMPAFVGRHVHTVPGKGSFDARPVRKQEDAAGIEKNSFEHGVLYRHES